MLKHTNMNIARVNKLSGDRFNNKKYRNEQIINMFIYIYYISIYS